MFERVVPATEGALLTLEAQKQSLRTTLKQAEVQELSDSLSNARFQEQLANLHIFYELQSKENEIERLTLDNQFKDLKIRQKRLTNYLYVSLTILMLAIVFLTIRSYRKIKEKNVLLQQQKRTLEATQQQLVQSE